MSAPFWVQHLEKNACWELVPGKMNMGILEISSKQTLFRKQLPGANHYAHETRSEILSKTPVSILEISHHEPKTIGKPPSIVSWPECQYAGRSLGSYGMNGIIFYRRILLFLTRRHIFLSSYFINLVHPVACMQWGLFNHQWRVLCL